jgi:GH18 family chitinase
MLYDYTGSSWSATAGANTPLYGDSSINATITWFLANSIPKEKVPPLLFSPISLLSLLFSRLLSLSPLHSSLLFISSSSLSCLSFLSCIKLKMVFGFANYGRTFTLSDPYFGAPNTNLEGGTAGKCDDESGYLTTGEIEALIADPPSGLEVLKREKKEDQFIIYNNRGER